MIKSFKKLQKAYDNFKALVLIVICNVTAACASSNNPFYIDEHALPQVSLTNKPMEKNINKHLTAFFNEFACDDGKMANIIIESQYLGARYVSASYSLAGYCPGTAAPFEYDGGFTYKLDTAALVPLQQFILKQDVEKESLKKYRSINKKDCPTPDYSGEFYLTEKKVVLKDFYSSKLHYVCEFEVALPRKE